MKINKNDRKLFKKEYLKVIEKINIKTFLKYDAKQYQCATCLNVFERQFHCPKCGSFGNKIITKGRTRYDSRFVVQTFRKEGKKVIELLFLIKDYQSKGFHRKIHLLRKSEYGDSLTVMFSNDAAYGTQTHMFEYYDGWRSRYEPEFKTIKYDAVRSYTLGWEYIILNFELLLHNEKLKYIYGHLDPKEFYMKDNRHFGKALKYPYLVEMLEKRSKRSDMYYSLFALTRYKKTYLKYFDYFERIGRINSKLLMKISKIKGKLKYDVFEKLSIFRFIPAEIKSKEELEMYSNLVISTSGRKHFDERDYKDYLRMASQRNLNIKSKEVLFDKKWMQLHDQWAAELKVEKELHKEKAFLEVYKSIPDEEINGILIETPHHLKDLFLEGTSLHHCVADYIDRVIEGDSLILFVREKSGESFLTAEVIDGRITQLRGNRNKTHMILPEHKIALNKYIKNLSLNGRKENAYVV